MNTKAKNFFWILALSSVLLLPACGKNEVKSQNPNETNLKSDKQATATATAAVSATPTIAIPGAPNASAPPMPNSYNRKHASSSSSSSSTSMTRTMHGHPVLAKKPVPMMAAPMATAVPTMVSAAAAPTFTPVTTEAPKKSGSRWPLIIAGVALVAAVGFYFWTKKTPPNNDFPLPPMGGLSPVSGFTAMRNKVQTEAKKQSFWTKKLF